MPYQQGTAASEDLESQDSIVVVRHENSKRDKRDKRDKSSGSLYIDSDYVLVTTATTTEHAAVMSSFERFGTHLLIWLACSTSLWGAIFVMALSFTMLSKKEFDPALIICIPMLMVWALASMWSAYKNRERRKALVISCLPVAILIAVLVWWHT
jgi:hypothetical protein